MDDLIGDSPAGTVDCVADTLLYRGYEIERLAKKKHREVLDHLGYRDDPAEEKLFGWIPEAYQRWSGLADPVDFSMLAGAMDPVLKGLGIAHKRDGVLYPAEATVLVGIRGADSCFDSWQGKAKKNFTDFSASWETGLSNQGNLAVALQDAMVGTSKIFETARADILDIAEKTVTALQAVGCGADDVKVTFTIASALAGVASVAFPPGGAVIALVSISAGAGAVSNLAPDRKEIPLGASTAKGVIDNMDDAMRTLARWIDAQEQAVVEMLKQNLKTVRSETNSYVPAPPNLLNSRSGGVRESGWLEPT